MEIVISAMLNRTQHQLLTLKDSCRCGSSTGGLTWLEKTFMPKNN